MSPKYPVLKPQEIIRALKKAGFKEVSQRGSHLKLKR
ncbi:type II toxin-antitoxin system HicA family toxin [Caldicellulosiruptor acetigenus]|nr:type II toxin-antitoxin system HicA family toxin [Caldicellulosiruptor acetigenus]